MKKIFTATLGTETNTFASIPTGHQLFEETCLFRKGSYGKNVPMFGAPLAVWRGRAEAKGWQVVESLCAFAMPAGRTVKKVYEAFRDEILADLRAAMPVDGVLLSMHGAMVAEGYDDCESDLLAGVRRIVGPDVPVGAELDLHCNIGEGTLRDATALVLFKEYPHIDVPERADDLFTVIEGAIEGRTRPVMGVFDCKMIGIFHTTREPMRGFVDKLSAMEGKDGVLSLSIGHGFPWADVKEMGTRLIAVTDNDKAKADALATAIGKEFVSMRGKTAPTYLSTEDGITAALAANDSPVVMADPADNAGGGAPSDNTSILRRLIERDAQGTALGPIWDPIAVRLCFDAGRGASFPLRFGGKIGPTSGQPIDATVTVTALKRDAWQSFGPTQVPLGDCAAIKVAGVEVVLITNRTQALGLELFRNLDIEPTQRKLVVVKSTNHFMAAFGPIAKQVIYVDSDGPLSRDYRRIPYTRVQRPIWPLDEHTSPGLIA
ncbi:MAG TPA: M81 family metallopeptidase [Reyranella sp.]|nr:M81 family metallopeptidase [Reyranella sp.]